MSNQTLENPIVVETEDSDDDIFKNDILKFVDANLSDLNVKREVKVSLIDTHVEIDLGNGVIKSIDYKVFSQILASCSKESELSEDVITGLNLPSNVIFISQKLNVINIVTYHVGGIRDMIYENVSGIQKKLKIAAPNIIISHSLHKDGDDWIVSGSYYFCTDLPVSKLPREFISKLSYAKGIYGLPMSNYYETCKMCYGNNRMPTRFTEGNLRGLDWYYKFLWETPFNNDLGIRAVDRQVLVKDWYLGLEKHAAQGKVFPYCDLKGYRDLGSNIVSESVLANLPEY